MSDEDVVYTLEVHVPGLARGETTSIQGLGEFKNGSTYEVTRAEHERFRALNPVTRAVEDEKTNAILGLEVTNGPTLLQWAKGSDLFTVTTAADDEDEDEDEPPPDDDEPNPDNLPNNENDGGEN